MLSPCHWHLPNLSLGEEKVTESLTVATKGPKINETDTYIYIYF